MCKITHLSIIFYYIRTYDVLQISRSGWAGGLADLIDPETKSTQVGMVLLITYCHIQFRQQRLGGSPCSSQKHLKMSLAWALWAGMHHWSDSKLAEWNWIMTGKPWRWKCFYTKCWSWLHSWIFFFKYLI